MTNVTHTPHGPPRLGNGHKRVKKWRTRKERKSEENREGETVTLINIEAVFEANKSFHNQFCRW